MILQRKQTVEFLRYSLLHHPSTLLDYTIRRLSMGILPHRFYGMMRRINDIQFPCDFRLHPMVLWMYHGIYEYPTTLVMRKYLQEGDIFLDVGANIGYFSAIGLDLVGRNGEVHSFEPLQQNFLHLKELELLNPDHQLFSYNIALGSEDGIGRITINKDNIGGSTLVSQLLPSNLISHTMEVPIRRLDSFIQNRIKQAVRLIKIDTEGYEFPVLRGATSYLDRCESLPLIICEVTPRAYPLLNTSLAEFEEFMNNYSYTPYLVSNPNRQVNIQEVDPFTDVLFIPE